MVITNYYNNNKGETEFLLQQTVSSNNYHGKYNKQKSHFMFSILIVNTPIRLTYVRGMNTRFEL